MDLSFQKKKTVGKSISQLLKYVTNNQIKKSYIFYGTPFILLKYKLWNMLNKAQQVFSA